MTSKEQIKEWEDRKGLFANIKYVVHGSSDLKQAVGVVSKVYPDGIILLKNLDNSNKERNVPIEDIREYEIGEVKR